MPSSPPADTALPARPTPRPAARAGFSLVEVMVSLVLVTVGISALGGLLLVSKDLREESVSRLDALLRLQTVLERIKGTSPDVVATTYGGVSLDVPIPEAGAPPVTVTVDATDPRLLGVTVETTWQAGGRAERLALRTDIHDEGG